LSVELAYAAGLFDGEGCVIFNRRGTDGGWQTELSLSNCDIRALEYMKDLFGGSVRMAVIARNENRYPIGAWTISGKKSADAAKAMLPYSVLKREQLKLYLEGRATIRERGGRPPKGEMLEKTHINRQRISTKIKSLKRPQLVMSA
jgi:hypothetical protein